MTMHYGSMSTSGSDGALGGGDLFGDRLFNALEKQEPAAGSLLVSAPDMPDANFARSIIYLVEHDPMGTLGVALTRRSEMAVTNILPAWSDLCSPPEAFYIGGPVKPDTGIALAVLEKGVDPGRFDFVQPVEGRVCVLDLDGDPDEIADHIEGMRVFVGYAGWSPGQLQDELDRGDWYVAHSLPSDLIAPAWHDVWAGVLARQPMPLPIYSTFVSDGSVN